MPRTAVIFYREEDGTVPLVNWLDDLPKRAKDKCRLKLERLQDVGHELRRPEADYLRDGIYELRVRLQRVNYRMLYFFHGTIAAIVSHGIIKEREVPPTEIEKAIQRKQRFMVNPERHAFREIKQ